MEPFLTRDRIPSDLSEGAVLLVDKPLEWTSFDVVNKLRYCIKPAYGRIKVGHAGTLDPLASGLLIICVGKMTRQIDRFQGMDKSYTGKIKLGFTTASYDRETPEENPKEIDGISLNDIRNAAEAFKGSIEQLPPAFSAIKVKGQTAYKAARKGKSLELKPRDVRIESFQIGSYENGLADFEVICSKGTYIRSLANDLGAALGCGGYLHELRRTAIGEFRVADAWQLEELVDFLRNELPQKPADATA